MLDTYITTRRNVLDLFLSNGWKIGRTVIWSLSPADNSGLCDLHSWQFCPPNRPFCRGCLVDRSLCRWCLVDRSLCQGRLVDRSFCCRHFVSRSSGCGVRWSPFCWRQCDSGPGCCGAALFGSFPLSFCLFVVISFSVWCPDKERLTAPQTPVVGILQIVKYF